MWPTADSVSASRLRQRTGRGRVDEYDVSNPFPECQRCLIGTLLPLSDYDRGGATLVYKAWVCSNPACGFNLKIRRGDIVRDEPIGRGRPSHRRGTSPSAGGEGEGGSIESPRATTLERESGRDPLP